MSRPHVVDWAGQHLAGLYSGEVAPSPSFAGGQTAADEALDEYNVTGYASTRNEVWPADRRGASRLSPYIRHGLLPLPRVWDSVAGGPPRDVAKFRDELLWQEVHGTFATSLCTAAPEPFEEVTGSLTITGGTGRFVGATGSADLSGVANATAYHLTATGTITY